MHGTDRYKSPHFVDCDRMEWEDYRDMVNPNSQVKRERQLINRVMQEFASLYDKCLTSNESSSHGSVRDTERKMFDYVEGLCEDINSWIRDHAEAQVKIDTLKDETMELVGERDVLIGRVEQLRNRIHELENPNPQPRKCVDFMAHVDLLISRIEVDALDREFDDLDDEDLYRDYLSSRFSTLIAELVK